MVGIDYNAEIKKDIEFLKLTEQEIKQFVDLIMPKDEKDLYFELENVIGGYNG